MVDIFIGTLCAPRLLHKIVFLKQWNGEGWEIKKEQGDQNSSDAVMASSNHAMTMWLTMVILHRYLFVHTCIQLMSITIPHHLHTHFWGEKL